MGDEEDESKVCDKGPIRTWVAPLPEVVWSGAGTGLEGEVCGHRPVREGDLEEEDVHGDCEESLDEQRGAEVGAEPVEDSARSLVRGCWRRMSEEDVGGGCWRVHAARAGMLGCWHALKDAGD